MVAKVVIADKGHSDWRIVTRENPTPPEQLAAEELQRVIAQACGCALPIVTALTPPAGPEIALGGARGGQAPSDPDGEALKVHIAPDRIDIGGAGPRGVLYGAYEFLERCLGARFLTPKKTYVPRREHLSVPEGAFEATPSLRWRIEPYKCVRDPIFQARARINMGNSPLEGDAALQEALGHGYPYAYGHSIAAIVPDELFDAHPEYFPLRDGRREHGRYHQRCLTNPDVKRMAINWAKKRLRDNPGQRMIAIGQNDTYPDQPNNCLCPACRALDEREGTPMGSLLTFVNAVAEAIEPEFPNVTVTTLAYRYTRKAPRTVRPRKNVAIVLCSIECCFSHPISSHCGANYHDGPIGLVSNDAFVEDITAWSAISDKLLIWDYIVNFAHYLAPHPNLNALAPNMRYYIAHRAQGVYPEGAHENVGVEMDSLRAYVICRLMWDASRSAWNESLEYLSAYLGAAAAPVIRWLRLFNDYVRDRNIHLSTYRVPDDEMFPRALIDRADELFDQAEALAADEDALEEVRRMRMTVRYVRLCLYEGDQSPAQKRALIDKYIADMAELGVTGLHEGGTTLDSARAHLEKKMGLK